MWSFPIGWESLSVEHLTSHMPFFNKKGIARI